MRAVPQRDEQQVRQQLQEQIQQQQAREAEEKLKRQQIQPIVQPTQVQQPTKSEGLQRLEDFLKKRSMGALVISSRAELWNEATTKLKNDRETLAFRSNGLVSYSDDVVTILKLTNKEDLKNLDGTLKNEAIKFLQASREGLAVLADITEQVDVPGAKQNSEQDDLQRIEGLVKQYRQSVTDTESILIDLGVQPTTIQPTQVQQPTKSAAVLELEKFLGKRAWKNLTISDQAADWNDATATLKQSRDTSPFRSNGLIANSRDIVGEIEKTKLEGLENLDENLKQETVKFLNSAKAGLSLIVEIDENRTGMEELVNQWKNQITRIDLILQTLDQKK
jgi:hypothetical protein